MRGGESRKLIETYRDVRDFLESIPAMEPRESGAFAADEEMQFPMMLYASRTENGRICFQPEPLRWAFKAALGGCGNAENSPMPYLQQVLLCRSWDSEGVLATLQCNAPRPGVAGKASRVRIRPQAETGGREEGRKQSAPREAAKGTSEMIYRRGAIYWYEFNFNGSRIRESACTTSKTIARQAEQHRRRELELGVNGLRKRERPFFPSPQMRGSRSKSIFLRSARDITASTSQSFRATSAIG